MHYVTQLLAGYPHRKTDKEQLTRDNSTKSLLVALTTLTSRRLLSTAAPDSLVIVRKPTTRRSRRVLARSCTPNDTSTRPPRLPKLYATASVYNVPSCSDCSYKFSSPFVYGDKNSNNNNNNSNISNNSNKFVPT